MWWVKETRNLSDWLRYFRSSDEIRQVGHTWFCALCRSHCIPCSYSVISSSLMIQTSWTSQQSILLGLKPLKVFPVVPRGRLMLPWKHQHQVKVWARHRTIILTQSNYLCNAMSMWLPMTNTTCSRSFHHTVAVCHSLAYRPPCAHIPRRQNTH